MDSRKRHHRCTRHRWYNMSMFVIFSSDKSKDYFPNNSPARFRSHSSAPLVLKGLWKVALMEVSVSTSFPKTDALFIYSSICHESIVNGYSMPLLRRLMFTEPGNWSTILDSPHYIPVKVSEIRDIDIFVTDEQGDTASFLNQTSTITLHFRAFPFL